MMEDEQQLQNSEPSEGEIPVQENLLIPAEEGGCQLVLQDPPTEIEENNEESQDAGIQDDIEAEEEDDEAEGE